jgi:hypothetical protein
MENKEFSWTWDSLWTGQEFPNFKDSTDGQKTVPFFIPLVI